MRAFLCLIGCACVVASGCDSPQQQQWPHERRATMNRWMVEDFNNEAIRNGVIAQHTLYSHHFVDYGAALNPLGERDLGMLATHYRDNPGSLNVRRGDATDELYTARLDTVKRTLTDGGVDVARVTIEDADAGGDGMASEWVVVILKTKMDKPLTRDDADSGFILSPTGGMSR